MTIKKLIDLQENDLALLQSSHNLIDAWIQITNEIERLEAENKKLNGVVEFLQVKQKIIFPKTF